jgi:hypothetical protein
MGKLTSGAMTEEDVRETVKLLKRGPEAVAAMLPSLPNELATLVVMRRVVQTPQGDGKIRGSFMGSLVGLAADIDESLDKGEVRMDIVVSMIAQIVNHYQIPLPRMVEMIRKLEEIDLDNRRDPREEP